MNKELQKLLNEIEAKKKEVKSLADEDKLKEAQAAKEELKALQNKFNLLCDLEDKAQEGAAASVVDDTANVLETGEKPEKKNVIKAFVNIITAKLTGNAVNDDDMGIYQNVLTSDDTPDDEGKYGAGVTIPEDIRTEIIELRRSSDELQQYVNVENVTTKEGARNIETNADTVPFDNVDEAAEFPDMGEPKFEKIIYKIKKKGGILKITAELLEDTATNIMAYINKWIAKKTKTTRNMAILNCLAGITAGKEIVVSNLDSLKDIFNEHLDPAIADGAIVLTNQSGFNYLDKLKDETGKYILQPDPSQQTKGKLLFGEYPVIKLSKKTLKSVEMMDESDGETITGYKHPVYCGDLKAAITLFDRNVITIDLNDKGAGLWENDITGVKVRDRFDVQAVDKEAVVKGEITEVVNG